MATATATCTASCALRPRPAAAAASVAVQRVAAHSNCTFSTALTQQSVHF